MVKSDKHTFPLSGARLMWLLSAWAVVFLLAGITALFPVPSERLWVWIPVLSVFAGAHATCFRSVKATFVLAAEPPAPAVPREDEAKISTGPAPSQMEVSSARLRLQRLELLFADSQHAEVKAKQQTRRLWEVFYQLNHPAGFLDADGVILDVNAAAVDLIRSTSKDLRGKHLTDVELIGGKEVFAAPLKHAMQGQTVQFQVEIPNSDAGPHILVMSLKPVLNNGNIELLILEGHDITERIRAEEALQDTFNQFQQSQKMEAIGRLAGGIAHDFNNLLTSILGFSNMALEQLQEEDAVADDLQEVVQAANRAQNLTQKLLALSRKDVPDSQPIDLNQVLKGMDNLIRVTMHENLEMVVALDKDPCIIQVDPTSIEQVILNLAVNARDAMPRSGRLYISTGSAVIKEEAAHDEGLETGEYVVLTIRDTGYGMAPEVLEHAFEPFYTTKESGQGTGLGLSTVYAIIKQYQGVIRLHSQPGEGTEIKIFLPKINYVEQMMLNLPQHRNIVPLPTGDETILLVEDEDGVRRMASRMIKSLGYTLITAQDGEEGVQVAEAYNGRIDLIVTDVVMPNLSGPEMIDRLRLSLGHIPHLYVSGFTMDKLKEHGADDSEQMLIRKPYDRETLARRMREALDAEAGIRMDKDQPADGE
jgi:PAS domain S-box-containing protein